MTEQTKEQKDFLKRVISQKKQTENNYHNPEGIKSLLSQIKKEYEEYGAYYLTDKECKMLLDYIDVLRKT